MTDTRVTSVDEGAVRVLTLNRGEKKNAFDVEQAEQLGAALEAAETDASVRATVVTAEGDYFSAGADVRIFLNMATMSPEKLEKVARLYEPLRACRKPTIAMVQGHCVGMGVTILPHFDLVYAADHVTFTTPFVKLGLVLEYGSSFTLSRLIGVQRAKEMILRAAPLDAKTAAEWGLVTRIVPAAELRPTVMEIATEIAAHPAGAVVGAKRLIDHGLTLSFEEATQAEDEALADRYGSEENVTAVMAMMARRSRG